MPDTKPPAADAGPRQQKCEFCDNGQCPITMEMAIDAGDRSMAGGTTTCGNCGGDGWALLPPVPQEAAPPPEIGSNSVTYSENSSPYGETHICPTCNGYHAGGCHRAKATAPDSAMRVGLAERKIRQRFSQHGDLARIDDILAALIREAGSERERELRDGLKMLRELGECECDHSNNDCCVIANPRTCVRCEASRLLGGESK